VSSSPRPRWGGPGQGAPAADAPRGAEKYRTAIDELMRQLALLDPANTPPGQKPPITTREFNRRKRELLRAYERIDQQAIQRRVPCRCQKCAGKQRFPRYYMMIFRGREISFECFLEITLGGQPLSEIPDDGGMAEALSELSGRRERVGSVIVGRA